MAEIPKLVLSQADIEAIVTRDLLTKGGYDALPWRARTPDCIVDANGQQIFRAVRFDDRYGHMPSNEANMQLLVGLSHVAASALNEPLPARRNVDPFQELQLDIADWADGVLPNRTPQTALLKMFEEVGELVRNPASPGEYADILIMLIDLARMHGVDLLEAARAKMKVNRSREWMTTSMGTLQHLEDE